MRYQILTVLQSLNNRAILRSSINRPYLGNHAVYQDVERFNLSILKRLYGSGDLVELISDRIDTIAETFRTDLSVEDIYKIVVRGINVFRYGSDLVINIYEIFIRYIALYP